MQTQMYIWLFVDCKEGCVFVVVVVVVVVVGGGGGGGGGGGFCFVLGFQVWLFCLFFVCFFNINFSWCNLLIHVVSMVIGRS